MDSKLKITVLYESWGDEEEEVAPEPEKKKRGAKKRRKKIEKHDREEIFEALEKLGHEPSYMMLDGEDKSLLALAKQETDLFFNIVESYAGDDTMEMHVAAFLDLLGRPYTGAGPQGLYLAQDKGLAKKAISVLQHPHAVLCHLLPGQAGPLAGNFFPFDREAGSRRWIAGYRPGLSRGKREGTDGAHPLRPGGIQLARAD